MASECLFDVLRIEYAFASRRRDQPVELVGRLTRGELDEHPVCGAVRETVSGPELFGRRCFADSMDP
jgi:hypothetical protein